ncbi:MAG: hypothetical protein WBD55_09315 [Dehalococcoidia bacterium]
MASERTESGGRKPRPGRSSGFLSRALRLVAGQVFGTRVVPTRRATPIQGGTSEIAAEPSAEPDDLSISPVEQAQDELEERSESSPVSENKEMVSPNPSELHEIVRRLEDALEHYRSETRRLADETSRIALVADRLETRLSELTRTLGGDGAPQATAADVAMTEPRFQPNERGVDLVISAVPGFQELMDAQRGLSGLPSVAAASVHRFQNGEASLEVTLSAPLGAREVVDGLRQATGHELVIEEVRPEASRLRLRFIEQHHG